jgi:hypothetical protein
MCYRANLLLVLETINRVVTYYASHRDERLHIIGAFHLIPPTP